MRREVSWSALVALAILVFPGQAPAHKLNLFATVEGSKSKARLTSAAARRPAASR